MPKICPRYAKDMTTKTVLTKRLPDETSKPVRLKKMSHKSVLTKRLPDKMSKPVLTKRHPDKTSVDLFHEIDKFQSMSFSPALQIVTSATPNQNPNNSSLIGLH